MFLFVHILHHPELAFDRRMQIGVAAIVMFLVLTGSLYGELIARIAANFATICRVAKLPLTVAAFGLTLFATQESVILFFALAGRMFI